MADREKLANLINDVEKATTPPETKKMRMVIAFQVEYDAPVDAYESDDPEEMAKQDTEAAMSHPYQALQAFVRYPGAKFRAKVTSVQTAGEKAGLEIK